MNLLIDQNQDEIKYCYVFVMNVKTLKIKHKEELNIKLVWLTSM